ncbi:ribonuclease III [Oleisolibacter albus]|uniref:ribonuclease III n=1 Tax=Oleisolibacter albus TaxID=2171757 RepID=UPI000DF1B580|nr:ribonuclease III [Oleisolibacter albus]
MSSSPLPVDPVLLRSLEDRLGHRFSDPGRLILALTHTSMAGVDRTMVGRGYERLEFLGDRVLGLVIAEWLMERFPAEPEGALARRLTALVRAEALLEVAEAIGLGAFIRLAPGEHDPTGAVKPAIMADACEAVIGALYLDGGLPVARAFIHVHWTPRLEAASGPPQDVKTALQEWALARGRKLPLYETLGRTGPDHAPVFEVRVTVDGHAPVTASGSSKRAAEKAAAAILLRIIKTGTA